MIISFYIRKIGKFFPGLTADAEFCLLTGDGSRKISVCFNRNIIIPSSISLAVNLILFVDASIKIHSRIGMVVFPGIAFRTIFTLFKRLLFEHTNFIVLITPLWVK